MFSYHLKFFLSFAPESFTPLMHTDPLTQSLCVIAYPLAKHCPLMVPLFQCLGPAGPKGSQGIAGDRGPQGVRGERGYNGTKGDRGEPGKRGNSGDIGKMKLF